MSYIDNTSAAFNFYLTLLEFFDTNPTKWAAALMRDGGSARLTL